MSANHTPGPCTEIDLDRRIAEKGQRRTFVVTVRIFGRRVEQTVDAYSTSEAAHIAFAKLGLSCASVRPA